MRCLFLVTLAAALARAGETNGKLEWIRGDEVTLHYDFSLLRQLDDFVEIRPKNLLPEGQLRARVEEGRLRLAGTGALVHRLAGHGLVRMRFAARVRFERDLGALFVPPEGDGAYVLVDLFDRRFKDDGGLLVAVCRPGPPAEPTEWREIAAASAGAVAKRLSADEPTDFELGRGGGEEFVRIGNLHRRRKSVGDGVTLEAARPGWWVQNAELEIEEATFTFRIPGHGFAFPGDAAARDKRTGALARAITEAPLSAAAASARRELSRRGEEGWKKLFSLARRYGRTQPYLATPLIRALGNGPEPGRRELLVRLLTKRAPPDYRYAVLWELAPWYPEGADLLLEGLAFDRVDYFRRLVAFGLPNDALQPLVHREVFAEEAHEILQDRGAATEGLGDLPRLRALEAISPVAARAFFEDFRAKPDFKFVDALVKLLTDDDKDARHGAHLLLMTLSGKDLPPDPDFWRSWVGAKRANYEAPALGEPGPATAAIVRGVRYLRDDLLADGACVWPTNTEWPACRVGATALAVYALRNAGVPPDDPAIRKALNMTLLVPAGGGAYAVRGDMERYTYALTLLCLALRSLDPERFQPQLAILAQRIVAGQLENGQWTYYCTEPGYGGRRPKAGDNSNTQYAILALRACRRSGIEIPKKVWTLNQRFWHKSVNRNGGWGYGPTGTTMHEFSMTTAGVATLAICIEALSGVKATERVKADKLIGPGMRRLGEMLFEKGYSDAEYYAFYGVERAAILAGVKAFRMTVKGKEPEIFDWYPEGAEILVRKQKENGSWGDPDARGVNTGRGYGEAVDTAYALLFLKRAVTGLAGADGGGVVEVPPRRTRR